jgi:hypothetical protein
MWIAAWVLALVFSVNTGSAQTVIASQGFETSGDTWTFNGAAPAGISAATGSGDTPANQRIRSGSQSWQTNNGTQTATLNDVSIAGYNSVFVRVRLSSTSTTTGNGAEIGDNVRISVALDGGSFPGTPDLTLTGNTAGNSRWGYDGTGTATTTAGTALTLAAPSGGNNAAGYATAVVNIPAGTNSVALRIITLNNATGEFWNIDDVELLGTPATSISTSAITGSPFNVTNTTGAAVSVAFTTSGTFGGSNVFTAQLSDATGSFAAPVAIGTGISPISATIPAATASGTGYRIRVVGSDPATTGTDNGTDLEVNLLVSTSITTDPVSGSPFTVTPSAGASVNIGYVATGTFNGGNTFTAQLSDASGSFATPTVIGSGTSPISGTIPAGTAAGTGYRIRVVADDPVTFGTDNGTNLQVILANAPTATTLAATGVLATEATLNGSVNDNNSTVTSIVFRYGTTAGGPYTNTIAGVPGTLAAGSGSTSITASLTGLTTGTTYYYVIEATNGVGTTAGAEQSFTPSLAPVCFAEQGFEAGDSWAITAGSGNISAATGGTDTPANQRILSGTNSWQVSGGTATLDLATQVISTYNNVSITIRLSSTSVTTGNGADGGDFVRVSANLDGAGFPATPDISLTGNTNARWGYNALLTGSTTAGTPISLSSTGGTSTNNHSTLVLNIPNGTSSVALRIVALNDAANEIWNIDDIVICGTPVSVTPCTEPLAQATALTFPTITSTQVDGSFTASGSADSYLVIRSNDATLDASPVDATTYAPGQSLAPGDTVVSFGTATTFSATGLASGTGYTFFVIAANSACVGGPDYLTASPLSGLATTVPAAPASFTTTCATGSSITVTWTLPSGVYDGVLLVVRESATLSPHSVASLDPATQAFDTDYSLAPTYGGTAPESRVVYKGTGTSATITGLTAGQTYRFQIYAYSGTTYSDAGANGPQTTRVAEINEASNFVAGSQNASATFSWNNPISGCFDDVLVVVSANPIATVPTATSYGANTIFGLGDELAVASGEFVVYQGTGTNVEVTGLTNGTLYYARVFVRVGAAWSTGVSATVTPLATTELQLGDIAVIAVNANDVGCAGVSASDEIYFVAFVDIATGTSLDITDNGWEHTTAGQFGDSEGIWRFTYTGATIPAGTIFSIKIRSGISATNSANPDWIASDINGSGISAVALNNSGDQFFVMQGGVWTNPAGANNATYDGKFLFGFNTATTWASAGSTTTSNLHPAVECANIAAASSTEQLYYNGPVTTASALDWFNRLRTPANWAAASDCANFATALTTNFPTNSIAIDGTVPTVATWTGAVDDNWFNCQNWDINRVPGENTDVVIPAAATVNCEIDATAPFAVNFGSANARNLNVEATAVSLILENSSNDILNVAGNLTLADGATLDMNGNAGTTGGTLFLSGNWINNSTTDAVDEGSASTVHFSGTTAQTLSNAAGEQALANVVMNNLAGLTLNAPLAVNAALTFTQGILTSTTTNPLRVGAAGSVSGQSNGSHVNGPVAKTGNTAFDFPIGNGTALRSLRIAAGGAASDEFTAQYFGNNPAPVVGAALAPDVAFISVNEYWSLNPASGTPNRIVTLTWNPASGVVSASDVLVVYYTGLAWTQMGGNGNAGGFTGNAANGTVTASDANTFGFLTLGAPTAFLPIELLSLTAQPFGGQIHLDWATSREENAAFFAVERSQDGNSFEEIGQVAAAGNSQVVRNYDFVDVQALRGESFYRLRMVDLDGAMQYSAAVKAFLGESNQLVVNGLYPNPAGQQVFAEVAAQTTAPVSVRVLTVEGKLVSTQAFESVTGVTTLQIELGQLPQGVYLLEFTQNGIRTVERVVKR